MRSLGAPGLAALAALCAFGAVAARRRPLLADLMPLGTRDGTTAIDWIGRLPIVRSAVSAPRLETQLAAARASTTVDRTAGLAVVLGAGIAGCVTVLGSPVFVLGPVLMLVAVRAPSFVVGRAARRRFRAIERDVPLMLDVLSLASFAGLPPPAALRRAVAVLDGPLAEEISGALQDVELGARWRDRLAELTAELPIPDLRRTVGVLLRTESIGAGTAEPIAILADEVRAARRARASERARKAPVKMLFPLVFLVLPAFLLLTVVPVLVATLGSIR